MIGDGFFSLLRRRFIWQRHREKVDQRLSFVRWIGEKGKTDHGKKKRTCRGIPMAGIPDDQMGEKKREMVKDRGKTLGNRLVRIRLIMYFTNYHIEAQSQAGNVPGITSNRMGGTSKETEYTKQNKYVDFQQKGRDFQDISAILKRQMLVQPMVQRPTDISCLTKTFKLKNKTFSS